MCLEPSFFFFFLASILTCTLYVVTILCSAELNLRKTNAMFAILVPGIMGTQLIVKDTLPKNNLASRFCSTNHKYKELWISPMRIVAHNICAKRELP